MGKLHCIFDKATGVFKDGSHEHSRDFNPATEVLLLLSEYPNRVEERWDGGGGVRPATVQEKVDDREVRLNAQAKREFDDTKAFRALIMWLAPLVGKPLAQARDEIKAIYRTLL